jgi:tetraacyldisaccharide-1-P 4'-kinase
MGFLVAMADGGLQDPALDRCLAARISHPDPPRGYADLHPFGPYRQLDRDARPVELVLELGRDVSPGLDPSSLPAPGTRVSVACGIARPELFRSQLETAGLVVEELRAMPDHGRFPNRLVHRIRSAPADWIVTAKDLARHPEIGSAHVARRRLAFTPRAESRLDALASLLRARAGSP